MSRQNLKEVEKRMSSGKWMVLVVLCAVALVVAGSLTVAGEAPKKGGLVALEIKLPLPMFRGTPKNIKLTPHMVKPLAKPRAPFLAPEGTTNVASGKEIASSDDEPIVGELEQVTDGDKKGSDGSYVELGPGRQWVQLDLGQACSIYAIVLWHYHGESRVYHDVVVQIADDADFITNVRPIFNNDYDNSSGLGIGKDKEYFEDYQGKLIDAKGVKARFIRLYSKGNTANDMNHYTEVEVYGKPAP